MYYIAKNNKAEGPYKKEELVSQGITKESLLWREGLQEWKTYDYFDELKELLVVSIQPPPIPLADIKEKAEIQKHKELSEKYDMDFPPFGNAMSTGIVLLFINLVAYAIIKINNTGEEAIPLLDESLKKVAYTIVGFVEILLRFLIARWCFNIAIKLNRNPAKWAFAAVFLPVLTLLLIGTRRKLKNRAY